MGWEAGADIEEDNGVRVPSNCKAAGAVGLGKQELRSGPRG